MTAVSSRIPNGTILIDGLPYALAKSVDGIPVWMPRQFQTQEGDPARPGRWRWKDWSRGMGDSRGAFRGSVEIGKLVYLGAPGRILPGPAVSEITTTLDGDIKDFVEVTVPASRILAMGGTKVAEINAATHAVAATATLSGTLLSGQLFEQQVAIAAGDSVDYYVRDAAGAYAQNSIGKKARCFGLSGSSLVRGYINTWSKCDATNITSVNNWSTEYDIGDDDALANQVFGHNRWDYVLKDDGLWTFDFDTSDEANLLNDLAEWKSSDNRSMFRWYDFIFLCTRAGLYRYIQQSSARPVGLEENPMNESELRGGIPTAGAALGHWGYVAYLVGTTTYICRFRRAMEGDVTSGSPFVFVDVVDSFTGECRAMRISNLNGTDTELYYAAGANVRYFALTPDGMPKSYRTTGTMVVKFAPSDLDEPMTMKQVVNFEIYGYNAAAGRTVQVACGFDRGSFNNVGAAISAFTAGYAKVSFTRGVNDAGRVVQPQITLTNDSASSPVEVRDVVMTYESRPIMVEGAVVGVIFRDYIGEGDVIDRRTAKEQRQAIEALLDGGLVSITDPWGDAYAARLTAYEGDPKQLDPGGELQIDVAFALRRLDY